MSYDGNQFGYCCGDFDEAHIKEKPPQCYSIPEINYKCSNDYLKEAEVSIYRKHIRYATCLDVHQTNSDRNCGHRELYTHYDEEV